MNISEALIEKYHQGLCSAREKEAVEKWLENGDEPDLYFPEGLSKEEIKMAVWEGLQSRVTRQHGLSGALFRKYAAVMAAAVIVVVSGFGYFLSRLESGSSQGKLAAGRPSETLQIEFGRESGAVYSKEARMLNFCGVIKITPSENMKLSFASTCDGNEEIVREVDVRGGTTYFAMDLRDHNSPQLIVMDKSGVGDLPPLLQNSLIAQFGI